MIKFLQQAATYLYEHHKHDLGDICVVLPSRRAGLFLKKHLSQLTDKPIFAPDIFSIEDFVFNLTGYRKIDPAYLIIEFYKVYQQLEGEKAGPFKEFVKWADVVIQDFNEVDLYLVDPDELFGFLSDAKAIALWNLDEKPLTAFEARYLRFFNSLALFYRSLTTGLLDQKMAYQGLAYRQLVGKVTTDHLELPWKRVVFAGFNALTLAEEKIIKSLVDQDVASLLWDADPYYLDNPVQEAGDFLRRNRKVLGLDSLNWTTAHFKSTKKTIRLIGVPKNIGQAKVAGELLGELQKKFPELDNSSIVLNDENLLFPVLNSLPERINAFNLTMGLPLKKTILFGLIEDFIRLNENALRFDRSSGKNPKFYFKDLLRIFEHPYFIRLAGSGPKPGQKPVSLIQSRNQIFYSRADVAQLFEGYGDDFKGMVSELFRPWNNSSHEATDGILFLLKKLKFVFTADGSNEERINTEYVFHFSVLFNKLKSALQSAGFLDDLESFRHLFSQMVRSITIPFYGEPLRGVQIMGMLETRTLDFENIIMLSVNEDFIPGKGIANSFIPFEIKRKFNLPTHRERNAVSAYHFYRLLQRAENVYLLYNTEAGELGGGDRSRYITQLEFELTKYNPDIRIDAEVVSLTPESQAFDQHVKIPKTADMLGIIQRHAERGFSASALNAYRNCTLQYYFKYILGLDEEDDVEETIEASTLGSVVHDVLFQLYEPLKAILVGDGEHKRMLTEAEGALKKAFQQNYPMGDISSGKNLLLSKVADSLVRRFIHSEAEWLVKEEGGRNELIITELEHQLEAGLSTGSDPGHSVRLKGVIDRVDRWNGMTRIIDYKTGRVEPSELRIRNWEELRVPGKNDKLFQLLFYAGLYLNQKKEGDQEIEAGIYSFRNLGQGFLTAELPASVPIADAMHEFEALLGGLIRELYDVSVPFVQTAEVKVCEYCSFKSICHR